MYTMPVSTYPALNAGAMALTMGSTG